MKRTIFYSWQSDLPNNSNRGFIEACINQAIKEINKVVPFKLEISIDRDTQNEHGTPNILESIFKKIDRSKIFIADISIINSGSNDRKCPNPNVLVELGYAARVLGWERIICLYNTDYGKVEDLPFDLRQRRPIQYSLKNSDKAKIKKSISKIISASIVELHKNGGLYDIVDDYIKEKVDTEILSLAGHLGKLLFNYSSVSAPEAFQRITNLSDQEIEYLVQEGNRIGFQIFKNFKIYESKLKEIADNLMASSHHSREMMRPLIELISWVRRYDAINSPRSEIIWFKEIYGVSGEYRVAPPSLFQKNVLLPNRFALLKVMNERQSIVTDFGDFSYKPHIDKLTNLYEFDKSNVKTFVSVIRQFVNGVNDWLDLTNGEIIIDFYENFELRSTANTGI